jgi:peptidoglycan/LPS O-acetylase OafA/YrhL
MVSATPPRAPMRLTLLDGMRGIAAIVVVLYHAEHFGLAGPLMQRGYLFVDFFFLLSGFVLGIAYGPKMLAGMPAWRFLWLRVKRLWPVMAIGAVIGLVPFAIAGVLPQALELLPLTLLLIPTVRSDLPVFTLNNPQWSLVLELAANVGHAFVLVRLPTRWLAAVVGAAGLALATAIAITGSNTLGSTGDNFALGPVRVLYGYGCGLVFARLWLSGRLPSWSRWRWSHGVLAPMIAVITLPFWPVSNAAGDIAVTLVLLPAFFALTVSAQLPRRLEPLFAGLGLLSYPLYAVHLPILTIVWLLLPRASGALIAPAAALVAAAAIARLFERRRGGLVTAPVLEDLPPSVEA